jgi:hypothetical protein
MAADFSELEAKVTALEGVVPSAVALLNGIQQEILDAVAADNLDDNSHTAQLAARVGAQSDALASAVAANTPAAPPTA